MIKVKYVPNDIIMEPSLEMPISESKYTNESSLNPTPPKLIGIIVKNHTNGTSVKKETTGILRSIATAT